MTWRNKQKEHGKRDLLLCSLHVRDHAWYTDAHCGFDFLVRESFGFESGQGGKKLTSALVVNGEVLRGQLVGGEFRRVHFQTLRFPSRVARLTLWATRLAKFLAELCLCCRHLTGQIHLREVFLLLSAYILERGEQRPMAQPHTRHCFMVADVEVTLVIQVKNYRGTVLFPHARVRVGHGIIARGSKASHSPRELGFATPGLRKRGLIVRTGLVLKVVLFEISETVVLGAAAHGPSEVAQLRADPVPAQIQN